jgi:hypothetical protein
MYSIQNNKKKLLEAIEFLHVISESLSNELKLLVTNPGEILVRLTRHTVYVRTDASNAASNWNIIDEETIKSEGKSSISKTKLPKNQVHIFDKIALGYAEGAATGKEAALDYSLVAPPAVLRNATLLIIQNGREVLELPVADIVKGQSSNSSDDNYHDLDGFHYLVDDSPMQWTLKFPSGETFTPTATKFNYIELRIQGFKTSRKQ